MLILYTRKTCPYCSLVRNAFTKLDIMFEEKDIALPEYEKELMEKGGKIQVPFLVDEERGVSMYESDDIIEYLFEYHGGN